MLSNVPHLRLHTYIWFVYTGIFAIVASVEYSLSYQVAHSKLDCEALKTSDGPENMIRQQTSSSGMSK